MNLSRVMQFHFQLCHKHYTLVNAHISTRAFYAVLDPEFCLETADENLKEEFELLTYITGARVKEEFRKFITKSHTKLFMTVHNQMIKQRIIPNTRKRKATIVFLNTISRLQLLAPYITHIDRKNAMMHLMLKFKRIDNKEHGSIFDKNVMRIIKGFL